MNLNKSTNRKPVQFNPFLISGYFIASLNRLNCVTSLDDNFHSDSSPDRPGVPEQRAERGATIDTMRLACACAAVLTMAATAVAVASSSPRLTPAMEATIRAVIEAQLEKRPEMRFNTTRLREIQDRAGKADSTNDDTVCKS